jgi:hypothetical protein
VLKVFVGGRRGEGAGRHRGPCACGGGQSPAAARAGSCPTWGLPDGREAEVRWGRRTARSGREEVGMRPRGGGDEQSERRAMRTGNQGRGKSDVKHGSGYIQRTGGMETIFGQRGRRRPPPMAARRTESLAFICLRVASGSGSLCASSAAPNRVRL